MAFADKTKEKNYVNEYIKNNYDRISLTIPKGKKDQIKDAAKKKEMSTNEFVLYCIRSKCKQMKIDIDI